MLLGHRVPACGDACPEVSQAWDCCWSEGGSALAKEPEVVFQNGCLFLTFLPAAQRVPTSARPHPRLLCLVSDWRAPSGSEEMPSCALDLHFPRSITNIVLCVFSYFRLTLGPLLISELGSFYVGERNPFPTVKKVLR